MKELNEFGLEDLYPTFSQNKITKSNWCFLTKEKLEEMKVSPPQLEKYLKKVKCDPNLEKYIQIQLKGKWVLIDNKFHVSFSVLFNINTYSNFTHFYFDFSIIQGFVGSS